jgi:hypothetical protein
VITNVSRGAAYDNLGRKLCSRCRQRLPKKGQRYCQPCFNDYMREWREQRGENTITVQLSLEEWEAVKAARQAKTAGRHARRSKEN